MGRSIILLCSLSLILINCTDVEPIDIQEPIIEEEFRTYLDRFMTEASIRNIDIDISKLSIVREPLQGLCGIGHFNYNDSGTQKVSISTSPNCWEVLTDYEREFLIFHELGHALLDHIHREGKFPDGSPVSIMCSGTCGGDIHNFELLEARHREYLRDQLFDVSINPPDYLYSTEPTVLFQENLGAVQSDWAILNENCTGYALSKTLLDNGTSALSITSPESEQCNAASWILKFDDLDIAEASFLRATVSMDIESIEGTGPQVTLESSITDAVNPQNINIRATQSLNHLDMINGTEQNRSVVLTFPEYLRDSGNFSISLSLNGNSTGTVHFKDILVEVFQPNL